MEPSVAEKFNAYPQKIRPLMEALRGAVYEIANTQPGMHVEESLKWGEPSYCCKGGSAIRMDWKQKNPEVLSLYFNCNTTLIETFKEIFPTTFEYVGRREIRLPVEEKLPLIELKQCFDLALKYHKLKHLPLLGM